MTKSKVGEVRVIGTNLNNKDIVDFTIVTNNSNSKEKSKSNRITDDVILEMISLLEDEKSVIETADILSISVASVYKYAKELSIWILDIHKSKKIIFTGKGGYVKWKKDCRDLLQVFLLV